MKDFQLTKVRSPCSQQIKNQRYWTTLGRFAILVGDWSTALLCCRDYCPKNPLALQSQTILNFIRMKIQKPIKSNFVLVPKIYDPNTKGNDIESRYKLIADFDGNPIPIDSRWNSPGNIESLITSLNALQNMYIHLSDRQHQNECSECIKKTFNIFKTLYHTSKLDGIGEMIYHGCEVHVADPCLRSRGNPLMNTEIRKKIAELKDNVKLRYNKKGNIQLLPRELRAIRKYLISTNKNEDLQMYCIILHGIVQFLRINEVLNIKQNHLHKECTLVDDITGPSAVIFGIAGKCENDAFKDLAMYRNDEFPEFCPLRHILLYMRCCNISSKDVYLYPDLKKKEMDVYVPIQYKVILEKLKHYVSVILNRPTSNTTIFGTHILRKTGYLFAIWGCLNAMHGSPPKTASDSSVSLLQLGSIMMSARHKKLTNAMLYARDAFTQWNYEQHNPHVNRIDNRVGEWKSIYIAEKLQYATAAHCCNPFQDTIEGLAKHFVHNIHHVSVLWCDFLVSVF